LPENLERAGVVSGVAFIGAVNEPKRSIVQTVGRSARNELAQLAAGS
jgi:excinuclease UvrABC helicase subunit UvrB